MSPVASSLGHQASLSGRARTSIEENVRFRPRPEELSFLPSQKNPCWKDSIGIHCLPSVFFGGFSKCSTTDVYNRLTRHPRIAHVTKGLGYWTHNNRRNFTSLTDYASVFGEVKNENMLAIDGTGSTFGNAHWTEEGPVPAASLIVQYVPDAKFIVLLRDPVDRLYSKYNNKLRKNPSRNPDHSRRVFHEAVERVVDKFKQDTSRGVKHAAYTDDHLDGLSLRKGLYYLEGSLLKTPWKSYLDKT